jgi:hypothetical protein
MFSIRRVVNVGDLAIVGRMREGWKRRKKIG